MKVLVFLANATARATLSVALTFLSLAAPLLASAPATAQHLDPPLGWDIWDPTWPARDV